jgi:adenosylcobinamide-GDP ribazoletransferase
MESRLVKVFSPPLVALSNFATVGSVSGLVRAARYLTIVPVRGRQAPAATGLGRAAAWFPVVGAAIGLLLIGADHWLSRAFPALLAALLTVTLWKVLTGGLHLDGLADCLDGLGGHSPEHRRLIMRDSRIGTFGAVGLVLFLMIEIVALSGLDAHARWRALLLAPTAGRVAPPLVARLFRPAGEGGQGAAFMGEVGRLGAMLAVVVGVAVALAAFGASGLLALVVALAAALLTARFVAARVGGVTGDVLGAAVEVAELAVLLTVAGWPGARR